MQSPFSVLCNAVSQMHTIGKVSAGKTASGQPNSGRWTVDLFIVTSEGGVDDNKDDCRHFRNKFKVQKKTFYLYAIAQSHHIQVKCLFFEIAAGN